jgi:hypothetical protein
MDLEDFQVKKVTDMDLIQTYNFTFEVDLVGLTFTCTHLYTDALRK